jgi:DNA-binding MarR family transcriptional regulator
MPRRSWPAAAAFTALVLAVFRLNGRLLAAGDRLAAPLGLTSARWQVLGAIAEGPLPASGIARAMGLTRQSVQRLADALAAEGIVAFGANPRHRRAKLVAPTARGRRLLARIGGLQAAWARRVSSGEMPREIAAAAALLVRLSQRVERDPPRGPATRRAGLRRTKR